MQDNMKICKACNTEYSDELTSCPNCGSNKYYTADDLQKEKELLEQQRDNFLRSTGTGPYKQHGLPKRLKIIIGSFVLLALVLISFVGFSIYKDKTIRETLDSAINCYEEGNYGDAINIINDIPENSKYFSEAQTLFEEASTKYTEQVIEETNSYLKDNDYETALETINYACDILNNDSLIEQKNNISSLYKNKTLSEAEKFIEDKNYQEAIESLSHANSILMDKDLSNKLTSCKSTYRESVEKKARKNLAENGYESAMEVLQEAKTVLKNDDKLNALIEEFYGYQPLYLYDVKPYEVNRYAQVGVSEWSDLNKDNYENIYNGDGVIVADDDGWDAGNGIVRYYLNKEYSILEGDVYVPYESRNLRKGEGLNGDVTRISIYGDGNKLYTCEQIMGTDKPYHFMIDITGVEFLEVRAEGGWYKGDVTGTIPTMCVANLSISRR